MTKISGYKLWKYSILRHLPGRFGDKYNYKYISKGTEHIFNSAMQKTAGMLAIDLGANIGEYTNLLAARASRVIAFEPDKWTVERLRENTKTLSNVEVIQAAAGIEDGEVTLYRMADFEADPEINSQSSSVLEDKYNVSFEHGHTVRQIDIIRYIRELDQDIGILKVDIEGAEVDILEKLFEDKGLLSRIHYIFSETHETKIPGHEPRVEKLRMQALSMKKPLVNLYWH